MQELKLRMMAVKTAQVKMDFMRLALGYHTTERSPAILPDKEKNDGVVLFYRLSSSEMTA